MKEYTTRERDILDHDYMRLARDQYEQKCADFGVESVSDTSLGDYGDKHGDYSGNLNFVAASHWEDDANFLHIMYWVLRQARFRGMADEIKQQANASANVQNIAQAQCQAWGKSGIRHDEACDRCGKMSDVDNASGLCRKCQG